jgi:hypothetical protein
MLHKEIYTTKGAKTKTFNVKQVAHKAILEQFGRSSLSNGTGKEWGIFETNSLILEWKFEIKVV